MRVAPRIDGAIVGIDVGEDFLDLAIVDAGAARLRLARVAVKGVEGKECPAIEGLRRRLMAAAPELGAAGTLALIDSPRWPRDLDLEGGRKLASRGRAIDASLRTMVRDLELRGRDGRPFRLSLYPTPRLEYFAACVRDGRCKPHLGALGRELFGAAIDAIDDGIAPAGGRIFTRFMIAGFAAYRAIEGAGVESYEGYPDLAFRLWAGGADIPSKKGGRVAFEARAGVIRRLAEGMGCRGARGISTLDEADAAVLALGAARAERVGVVAVIERRREGRFALALDGEHARRVNLVRRGRH